MAEATATKTTTTTTTTFKPVEVEKTTYKPTYSNIVTQSVYTKEQLEAENEQKISLQKAFGAFAANPSLFVQKAVVETTSKPSTVPKIDPSLFVAPVSKEPITVKPATAPKIDIASKADWGNLLVSKNKTFISFAPVEVSKKSETKTKTSNETLRASLFGPKVSQSVSTKKFLESWIKENSTTTTSESLQIYRDINLKVANAVLAKVDTWSTLKPEEFQAAYRALVTEEKEKELAILQESLKTETDLKRKTILKVNITLLKNKDNYLFKSEAEILSLHQMLDELITESYETETKTKDSIATLNEVNRLKEEKYKKEVEEKNAEIQDLKKQVQQGLDTINVFSQQNLDSVAANKELQRKLEGELEKNRNLQKEIDEAKKSLKNLEKDKTVQADKLSGQVAKIERLERELKEKKKESSAVVADYNLLLKENQNLQKTITSLQEKSETKSANDEKVAKSLKKMQKALEAFSNKSLTADANYVELDAILKELEKEDDPAVKSLVSAVRQQSEKFKETVSKYEQELRYVGTLKANSDVSSKKEIEELKEANARLALQKQQLETAKNQEIERIKSDKQKDSSGWETDKKKYLQTIKDLTSRLSDAEKKVRAFEDADPTISGLIVQILEVGDKKDEQVFSDSVKDILRSAITKGQFMQALEAAASKSELSKGVIKKYMDEVFTIAKKDLEKKSTELQNKITGLEGEKVQLNKKITDQQRDFEELKNKASLSEAALTEANVNIRNLEKKLTEKKKERDDTVKSLEDKMKNMIEKSESDKQLKKVQDELTAALTKNLSLTEMDSKKVAELQKELTTLKEQHVVAIETLKTKAAEDQQKLLKDLLAENQKLKDKNAAVKNLQNENDKLNNLIYVVLPDYASEALSTKKIEKILSDHGFAKKN